MRKTILLILVCIILTGCIVNTPDTASIEATVAAAVSTAIAPYESRYNDFVTIDMLTASQLEQNGQIQQYVADQIVRQMNSDGAEINPTAVPTVESGTVIEYADGVIVPTKQTYSYDNKNSNCVDAFTYVSDLTVPDGMAISPKTNFKKSWYITNSGDCVWNSSYKVVYQSGDLVSKANSFSFLKPGYFVQPGESVTVSADLTAPLTVGNSYTTYWAIENDRGEKFGSGAAKNVYLSSSFLVSNIFDAAQNFGSLTCSDDMGPFMCGVTNASSGRGVVYYDSTPMLESGRSGKPAIAVQPPVGENTTVRFEFGPLFFPRGSWFYTNFCCRPNTPHCDTQIRLYVREPGYGEQLVQEIREWNDGLMGEWKFKIDDLGIFDQEFYYIFEVQSNGGADSEDLILFTNTRIY